jgi:Tol biopolymer transport system component
MRSPHRSSLGGALAGALLVVAACGGAVAPTAPPRATTGASVPTAAATIAAATTAPTAVAIAVPTLKPTVEGVRNGRIAYAVRANDGANIFSVLPDGTDVVQLTTGAGNHLCAAYSADGSLIAYCSDVSGQFEIWTMHADGTKQTQLTHLNGRSLFPDVSPSGERVAFGGAVGADAHTEVYVVDATTGDGLVALTSCTGKAPGCSNDYPAWSPDGKHIVFIHTDDFNADETPVNEQVWLMDADGGNQHALTTGLAPKDQVPSWSPDGKQIVYSSGVADSEGIWVMDADGSGQVQLSGCAPAEASPCAAGDDFGPVWSPDGTRIAFLRAFGAVGANDRPVYVMNADGTDQKRLLEGTILQTVPAWQALGM